MKRALLFIALALAAFSPPGQASAAELARFTCVRPRPWDRGSLRNVSVAASLVDGLVLKPGAVFSFNQAMSAGDGRFVRGTSFLAGREVRSSGGGICQVSSGLYNAALLAGLDVLERSGHSLYDPSEAYVPPGRDAMVTRSGHSDFRFRNSTAEDLTVQARVSGGRLTVVLLGRQRHARRRWIETQVLRRLPAGTVERPVSDLAPGRRRLLSPGFDGLVVADSLCWSAHGLTRCAALGVDHYARVDAVWAVGPKPSPASPAPSTEAP